MSPRKAAETRRLAAIMFTDIHGYSRMMQQDERRTLAMLDEHNTLLFPIIEARGGTVIKTVGDAILAVFDSCIAAVDAAHAIQEALAARADAKGRRKTVLRVRIGIHLGETVYKDNDVFGNGVNIAARLQPLADPGGICFSQAVYEQLVSHYGGRIVRVGPVALKNIAEPVVVYRMQVEGGVEPSGASSLPLAPAFVEPGQGGHVRFPPGTAVHRLLAVFGEVKREGKWLEETAVRVTAVFGNAHLDFSTTLAPHARASVRVTAVFAAVEILVSQQTRVRILGHGILGDFSGPSFDGDGPAEAPLLVVDGTAVFASIRVRVKGAAAEKKALRFKLELEGGKTPAGETAPSLRTAKQGTRPATAMRRKGGGRSRKILPAE